MEALIPDVACCEDIDSAQCQTLLFHKDGRLFDSLNCAHVPQAFLQPRIDQRPSCFVSFSKQYRNSSVRKWFNVRVGSRFCEWEVKY